MIVANPLSPIKIWIITFALLCLTSARVCIAQPGDPSNDIHGDNSKAALLETILTADKVSWRSLLREFDGSKLEREISTDLVKIWLYSIGLHYETKLRNAYDGATDFVVMAANDPSLELTDLGRHYLQQLFSTQFRRLSDAISLQNRMEAVIKRCLPAVAPALAHYSCTEFLKAHKSRCIQSLMDAANANDDPHQIASFVFLRQHFPETKVEAPPVEAMKTATQSKDIYMRLHALRALVLEEKFDIAAACSRQYANDVREELMQGAIKHGGIKPDETESRLDEWQRKEELRETEALEQATKEIESGIGQRWRGRGSTGYEEVTLTDWEMIDALIQRAGLLERSLRKTTQQAEVTARIEKDYDRALEICRKTKTALPADTYTPYSLFQNRGLYFKSVGDSMENQADADARSEFYRRAVVEYNRAEKALPHLKIDAKQRSNTLDTLLSFRSSAFLCLEEWQLALDDFATCDQIIQNTGRRSALNEYQLTARAKCYAGIGQLEKAIPLFEQGLENTFSHLLSDQFVAFHRVTVSDDHLASTISLAHCYHTHLTKLDRSSEIERIKLRLSGVLELVIDNRSF